MLTLLSSRPVHGARSLHHDLISSSLTTCKACSTAPVRCRHQQLQAHQRHASQQDASLSELCLTFGVLPSSVSVRDDKQVLLMIPFSSCDRIEAMHVPALFYKAQQTL